MKFYNGVQYYNYRQKEDKEEQIEGLNQQNINIEVQMADIQEQEKNVCTVQKEERGSAKERVKGERTVIVIQKDYQEGASSQWSKENWGSTGGKGRMRMDSEHFDNLSS